MQFVIDLESIVQYTVKFAYTIVPTATNPIGIVGGAGELSEYTRSSWGILLINMPIAEIIPITIKSYIIQTFTRSANIPIVIVNGRADNCIIKKYNDN